MKLALIYFLTVSFLLSACELFTTRNPEDPDIGRSNFVTPTEPQIVLENLKYSIIEKDLENYVSCMLKDTTSDLKKFSFIPSPDANSKYQYLFNTWSIQYERNYFSNLVSSIKKESIPKVNIQKREPPEFRSSDSVIYNIDYYMILEHNHGIAPKTVSGIMKITLVHDRNNLWSIIRWIDNQVTNDTNKTWSYLKAEFSN